MKHCGKYTSLDWMVAWYVVAISPIDQPKTYKQILEQARVMVRATGDTQIISESSMKRTLDDLVQSGWLERTSDGYLRGRLVAARRISYQHHEIWTVVKADDEAEDTFLFMVPLCDYTNEYLRIAKVALEDEQVQGRMLHEHQYADSMLDGLVDGINFNKLPLRFRTKSGLVNIGVLVISRNNPQTMN
jgi:hypothetical protein